LINAPKEHNARYFINPLIKELGKENEYSLKVSKLLQTKLLNMAINIAHNRALFSVSFTTVTKNPKAAILIKTPDSPTKQYKKTLKGTTAPSLMSYKLRKKSKITVELSLLFPC
jgi:ParB-like chromosome segregation protein Spo0J